MLDGDWSSDVCSSDLVSTTHVHMDHDNCLEVIIVRGKAKEIQ
jgi:CopG family nickel-responsive transcriptional regulator